MMHHTTQLAVLSTVCAQRGPHHMVPGSLQAALLNFGLALCHAAALLPRGLISWGVRGGRRLGRRVIIFKQAREGGSTSSRPRLTQAGGPPIWPQVVLSPKSGLYSELTCRAIPMGLRHPPPLMMGGDLVMIMAGFTMALLALCNANLPAPTTEQ